MRACNGLEHKNSSIGVLLAGLLKQENLPTDSANVFHALPEVEPVDVMGLLFGTNTSNNTLSHSGVDDCRLLQSTKWTRGWFTVVTVVSKFLKGQFFSLTTKGLLISWVFSRCSKAAHWNDRAWQHSPAGEAGGEPTEHGCGGVVTGGG
mmetsp:Transcript_13140/g.32222  ORF Transcript_13140/g.32222 Transcript_13140/m.32222 type:complete len:149 (+) Transcript_13140:363-809(+)